MNVWRVSKCIIMHLCAPICFIHINSQQKAVDNNEKMKNFTYLCNIN